MINGSTSQSYPVAKDGHGATGEPDTNSKDDYEATSNYYGLKERE